MSTLGLVDIYEVSILCSQILQGPSSSHSSGLSTRLPPLGSSRGPTQDCSSSSEIADCSYFCCLWRPVSVLCSVSLPGNTRKAHHKPQPVPLHILPLVPPTVCARAQEMEQPHPCLPYSCPGSPFGGRGKPWSLRCQNAGVIFPVS